MKRAKKYRPTFIVQRSRWTQVVLPIVFGPGFNEERKRAMIRAKIAHLRAMFEVSPDKPR